LSWSFPHLLNPAHSLRYGNRIHLTLHILDGGGGNDKSDYQHYSGDTPAFGGCAVLLPATGYESVGSASTAFLKVFHVAFFEYWGKPLDAIVVKKNEG